VCQEWESSNPLARAFQNPRPVLRQNLARSVKWIAFYSTQLFGLGIAGSFTGWWKLHAEKWSGEAVPRAVIHEETAWTSERDGS